MAQYSVFSKYPMMMILSVKHFSLILLIFFNYISASAQDSLKKNEFRLSTGIGVITRQDRIFSPLLHNDLTLISPAIEFTREARLYQDASLRFAMFDPIASNSFEYMKNGERESTSSHSFIFARLRYSLGKTWTGEKSSLTAAMMVQADIQALTYVYGRISSFGYFASIGPGIMGKYQYRAGEKGRVSARLALPLLSLYARSPYLVNDDEYIENISSHSGIKTFMAFIDDGEWVTWDKLQKFDISLGYDYDISEKWGLGGGWMLDFIHTQLPRKLVSSQNTFFISIYF
jgi:hypothetical protein